MYCILLLVDRKCSILFTWSAIVPSNILGGKEAEVYLVIVPIYFRCALSLAIWFKKIATLYVADNTFLCRWKALLMFCCGNQSTYRHTYIYRNLHYNTDSGLESKIKSWNIMHNPHITHGNNVC